MADVQITSSLMLYPQIPVPDIPIQVEKEHNTLITQLQNGIEYRRRFRLRQRRKITLLYKMRKKDKLESIYSFFSERYGAFEDFIFEFPYEDTYKNEYIGRGDGSSTLFTLPFKTYSSLTVYIDGVITTTYTVDISGERATINFTSAPAQNSLITCDFVGKARLKTRFANDVLQTEYRQAGFVNLSVNLIEVLD